MLSTSTGLTKTVYNPAALKAAQKSLLVSTPAVDNNEAQKKKQVSTDSMTYIQSAHRKTACVRVLKTLNKGNTRWIDLPVAVCSSKSLSPFFCEGKFLLFDL